MVKKDSFDAVLIELKYLTDSLLVDSSYFETLTNYFRQIRMNHVERGCSILLGFVGDAV